MPYYPPATGGGGSGAGGVASLTSPVTIANTETVILNYLVPANTMVLGTTYRFMCGGLVTASAIGTGTVRIRVGPTTLTGSIAASCAPLYAVADNGDGVSIDGWFTLPSTTTVTGWIVYTNVNHAANSKAQTTIVTPTIDPTVANLVEVTYISGISTTIVKWSTATIELVVP